MPHSDPVLIGARRAVRRAVTLPCEMLSEVWDVALPQVLTDLSPYGAFLETPLPLSTGDEVVLAFTPGRGVSRELCLSAKVARVTLGRRPGERQRAGMGLAFEDLGAQVRDALSGSLRGLPPPLPRTREIRTFLDVPVIYEEDLGDRVNELSVIEHLCLLEEPLDELDDDQMITALALAHSLSALMTG